MFLSGAYSIRIETTLGSLWRESPSITGIFSSTSDFEGFTALTMIASASLTLGQFVETVGYNTNGDGGDNLYEVVASGTGTADGGSFIDLPNTTPPFQAKALFPKGTYNVAQWGAIGDGVADSSLTWQPALDYADAQKGLTINVPSEGQWLLGTALTMGNSVSLVREGYAPIQREMGSGGSAPDLDGLVSVFAGTAIKAEGEGVSVEGLSFIRNTLVYPVANTSSYTGNGISIEALAHDCIIRNCNFFGFNQAIATVATNTERPWVIDCKIDCVAGIKFEEVRDNGIIENCHCWPFLTVHNAADSADYRSGVAYNMVGNVDWTQVVNCFSFHYEDGFLMKDVTTCTFIGCQADGAPGDLTNTTTVGFNIDGDCRRARMIGCTSFALRAAYLINNTTAATNHTTLMSDCSTHNGGPGGTAVLVNAGKLMMIGCNLSNWDYGIFRQASAGFVSFSNNVFHDLQIAAYADDAAVAVTGAWGVGPNEYNGNTNIAAIGAEVPSPPGITMAGGTGTIPLFAPYLAASNTNTLTNVTVADVPIGVPFIIGFTTGNTQVNSTGNIDLVGGLDKIFNAKDTLTLVFNGLTFSEVSRSEN